MTTPKVSVLMTAYNCEKYIAEAIESVLNSTFTDFELIVVDDKSCDRTLEIARHYLNQDDRVKVFANDQNLGDYPNRNRAASLASGEYIKYVDADDIIYPHGLKEFVLYLDRYPQAAFAISEKRQDSSVPYPTILNPLQVYRDHYLFGKDRFGRSPLTTIIRRDAFQQVGGFTGRNQVGDFEFWHLLAQRFDVLIIPGGLVWYRIHSEQQSEERRTDITVRFNYLLVSLELIDSALCPLPLGERLIARRKISKAQAMFVLRCLINCNFRIALRLKHMAGLSCIDILRSAS